MSSLFISYSRKDIETARKLTQSFDGQGLDFWIDWEGIPPTLDWWKEIERGIEGADIFLFLISPDSAKSKVCKQEIEHAAKNGKRLIPVVVRDIKADDAPAELKSLNWIFIRENDDFDTGFDKLITAIKTDYEWAQTHRQLQVKALEWERNNRENGFLLLEEPTGGLLSLAFSPDGKILASGGVDGTTILWDVTTHQPIGNPLLAYDGDWTRGVAFSPDSKMLASATGTTNLWDVETPTVTGQRLIGHRGVVASVAFSPDGRILASGGGDGTIILWELNPESWIKSICQRVNRNFTRAEWEQYFPNEAYRITCSQWPPGK